MTRTARKLPILMVSILMATGLWLYVRAQNALIVPQSFPIKLVAANLDPNLIVTRMPATVNVIVEGMDLDLRQIDEKMLARVTASVDLSSASDGLNYYKVSIRPPTGSSLMWKPQGDGKVLMGIDKRVRRPFGLTVVKQGLAPDGIEVGDVLLQPDAVMLDGPETQMNLVEEVRATLDMSEVKPGETYEATVEVFGKDKGPMPLITSEPQTVTLRPIVANSPPTRNVLVVPEFTGQLPFGAEVIGYEVTPNQLRVQGKRETLAQVLTISTQPVDLSTLTESRTLTLPLKIPDGVLVIDSRGVALPPPVVRVQIVIRTRAAVPPPSN